ncbi:hypothetical protein GEMRC1_013698 [Eukaryota sp. GEM-RC1]
MFHSSKTFLSFVPFHSSEQPISILNGSTDPVKFIVLPIAQPCFSFVQHYSSTTSWIAPGNSLKIVVAFTCCDSSIGISDVLHINIHAKSTGALIQKLSIPIIVSSPPTSISLPKLLDFGSVPFGSSRSLTLTLPKHSQCTETEHFTTSFTPSNGFSVHPPSGTLPSSLVLTFTPSVYGTSFSRFVVDVDTRLHSVSLSGSSIAGSAYDSVVREGEKMLDTTVESECLKKSKYLKSHLLNKSTRSAVHSVAQSLPSIR